MQDLSWFYSEGSGEAARLRRGPDGGLQQNWGHGSGRRGKKKPGRIAEAAMCQFCGPCVASWLSWAAEEGKV